LMAGVREDVIDKVDAARADGFVNRHAATAPWFSAQEGLFANDSQRWSGNTFGELFDVLRDRISARRPNCQIGCSFLYTSEGLYVVRAYGPDLRELEE
jgi:hypothetical protein